MPTEEEREQRRDEFEARNRARRNQIKKQEQENTLRFVAMLEAIEKASRPGGVGKGSSEGKGSGGGRPLANFEDRVEREVRRRLLAIMTSAGVSQGRIDAEVLYLLPEEFVRIYAEIYEQAFGDRAQGTGSSMGHGVGDEGRQVARGRATAGRKAGGTAGLATRQMYRGGQTKGKRYTNPATVLGKEAALDLKKAIDKDLLRIIRKRVAEHRLEAHGKSRGE